MSAVFDYKFKQFCPRIAGGKAGQTFAALACVSLSLLFFLASCEIGNVTRRESMPGFAASATQAAIFLVPVVDRTGTIRNDVFHSVFVARLREFRPEYRFEIARIAESETESGGDLDSALRDYADVVAAALDPSADPGGLRATDPAFAPENRPALLRERWFAITIIYENSVRRENRTEFVTRDEPRDPVGGDPFADGNWRDVTYIESRFRGDFVIFAPGRGAPAFFARYERDSAEPIDSAEYDSAGDESVAGACVSALGQCLWESALQVVTAGRADSPNDNEAQRFMKAIALELPEN